jgi:hypothetical protein
MWWWHIRKVLLVKGRVPLAPPNPGVQATAVTLRSTAAPHAQR